MVMLSWLTWDMVLVQLQDMLCSGFIYTKLGRYHNPSPAREADEMVPTLGILTREYGRPFSSEKYEGGTIKDVTVRRKAMLIARVSMTHKWTAGTVNRVNMTFRCGLTEVLTV
jgi:hypothetical protein